MKDSHRRLARKRYWDRYDKENYFCPDCGRAGPEMGNQFEVHHKDGNPHNNSMDNLVGLCPLCHAIRENRKPSMGEIKRLREHAKPPIVPSSEPRKRPFPHNQSNPLDYLVESVKRRHDTSSITKWSAKRSGCDINIYQRIKTIKNAFSPEEMFIREGWELKDGTWHDPNGQPCHGEPGNLSYTEEASRYYRGNGTGCGHPSDKLKTKIVDNSPLTVCERCGEELAEDELPVAEKVKHFKLVNEFKKTHG